MAADEGEQATPRSPVGMDQSPPDEALGTILEASMATDEGEQATPRSPVGMDQSAADEAFGAVLEASMATDDGEQATPRSPVGMDQSPPEEALGAVLEASMGTDEGEQATPVYAVAEGAPLYHDAVAEIKGAMKMHGAGATPVDRAGALLHQRKLPKKVATAAGKFIKKKTNQKLLASDPSVGGLFDRYTKKEVKAAQNYIENGI
jgi:hypothetical protein